MQNKFSIALTFSLITIGTVCRADIVFMNFHESPDELAAVQKAAHVRGEKLWVISPNHKDEVFRAPLDKKIAELDAELDKIQKTKESLWAKSSQLEDQYKLLGANKPWYEKVWDGVFHGEYLEMAEIKASMQKVQSQLDEANALSYKKESEESKLRVQRDSMKKDLNDTLTQIEKSGKSLSTLIVSGHHGGTDFWGNDNLQIDEKDLRDVLKAHPKATQTFYSFVGWGCHTGELDDIKEWKEAFPQLKVIVGFAGSGPLAKTRADHTALEDLLLKESEFMVAQDMKVAQKNISKIKDANVTYLAGMVNQCYVGTSITKIDPLPFSSLIAQDCAARKAELIKSYETYKKYFNANLTGFEDVPDPENLNSPLRLFYNNLETYRGCYRLYTEIENLPSGNDIVGLIHAKIIQKNFEAFYGVTLGKTRKETREKIYKLSDNTMKRAAEKLNLMFKCVPPSWITEEPTAGQKPAAPDTRCLSQ